MLLFLAKITLKPNQKSKAVQRWGMREREKKKGRKRVYTGTAASRDVCQWYVDAEEVQKTFFTLMWHNTDNNVHENVVKHNEERRGEEETAEGG